MSAFEPWTVVKVPFPYNNRPIQQYRPALIIAHAQQEGGPSLLWVLMITSAENRSWGDDIPVSDLRQAGLAVPCVIRPSKIAAIESKEAEKLGTLVKPDCERVADYMSDLLDPFYKNITSKA